MHSGESCSLSEKSNPMVEVQDAKSSVPSGINIHLCQKNNKWDQQGENIGILPEEKTQEFLFFSQILFCKF